VTTQLVLAKITIDIQKALLDGLTEARDDDSIIDFDACIDSSDNGRVDALIALLLLFWSKLEGAIERKRNALAKEEQTQPQRSTSLAPAAQSQSRTPLPPTAVPQPQRTPPPTSPLPNIKTRLPNVLRRKKSDQGSQKRFKEEIIPLTHKLETSPQASHHNISLRRRRRNTGGLTGCSGAWLSTESENSTAASDFAPPGSIGRSNSSPLPFEAPLAALTLSSITQLGRCCKNASAIMEGLVDEALIRTPIGGNMAYNRCASPECKFAGPCPRRWGIQPPSR